MGSDGAKTPPRPIAGNLWSRLYKGSGRSFAPNALSKCVTFSTRVDARAELRAKSTGNATRTETTKRCQAVGESRMPSKKAYTARIVCPSVLMTLILEIDGETAVKI